MTIEESASSESSLPPGEIVPMAELSAAVDPEVPGGGRRRLAARGVVINSAFVIGLGALNLVKSVVVVGFVSAAEFGVWSIVVLALYLVIAVKSVAVSDKYIQQREADQELAFRKAFTLELLATGAAVALMAALAGLLVLAYGRDELFAPALTLALVLPGIALQAPVWVFYRRLDFMRQRLLLATDPLVGFVVTIALAAAGLGYWSLVVGLVVGAWAGAVVALAFSPYRIRLLYERATMREYLRFSAPLMISVALGLMIAQLAVFFGDLAIGLAGAGAIGLAGTFSAYSERVDAIVTQTIYPVITRVRDRRELLVEAFVKSNRLALMWAVPFGIGLTLFVDDLVSYAIGEQWRDAVVLLQVVGVTAAVNHIGFNWGAFYRASGDTRPIGDRHRPDPRRLPRDRDPAAVHVRARRIRRRGRGDDGGRSGRTLVLRDQAVPAASSSPATPPARSCRRSRRSPRCSASGSPSTASAAAGSPSPSSASTSRSPSPRP